VLQRIKNLTRAIIRITQKILVKIFLFILYCAGFGLTALFLMIFKRDVLIRKPKAQDTFWITAEGYAEDPEDSLKQS